MKKGNQRYDISIKEWKEKLLEIIGVKAQTFKSLAKVCNVSAGGFAPASKCRASVALYQLIDEGRVGRKRDKNRNFSPVTFYLAGVWKSTPQGDSSAEENLIGSINGFLAVKKQQMEKELGADVGQLRNDRDYYSDLCKKYKAKIDSLEMELARRVIKF